MRRVARFRAPLAARPLGRGTGRRRLMAGRRSGRHRPVFPTGKKLVEFLVGFPPSGGYYAYSQLLTRFLGKHIPGQPTVSFWSNHARRIEPRLVQYLMTVAPKDGLTLGMFNRGSSASQDEAGGEVDVISPSSPGW